MGSTGLDHMEIEWESSEDKMGHGFKENTGLCYDERMTGYGPDLSPGVNGQREREVPNLEKSPDPLSISQFKDFLQWRQ